MPNPANTTGPAALPEALNGAGMKSRDSSAASASVPARVCSVLPASCAATTRSTVWRKLPPPPAPRSPCRRNCAAMYCAAASFSGVAVSRPPIASEARCATSRCRSAAVIDAASAAGPWRAAEGGSNPTAMSRPAAATLPATPARVACAVRTRRASVITGTGSRPAPPAARAPSTRRAGTTRHEEHEGIRQHGGDHRTDPERLSYFSKNATISAKYDIIGAITFVVLSPMR